MKYFDFSCDWKDGFKTLRIKCRSLESAFDCALYYFRGYFFDDCIDLEDIHYYGVYND